MSDYTNTQEYLYSLRNRGAKLGLERMVSFNEALGQPDRQFPIIHVAGTNGKGSVCAMLESIYRHAGLKTGMFTSPHLIRLGERVQVNRVPLTDAEIVHWVNHLKPFAESLANGDDEAHPTFFEFMTAMAFLQFARQAVDVAIVETGLGGRLDSTNVITPRVSVITSVSYDHQDLLGDTLSKIAREKAGIIKPGVPVVLGRLPNEAEIAIRAIAAERSCTVTSIAERFGDRVEDYPNVALAGDHQRINAATAWLAVEQAGLEVLPMQIREGLRQVSWAGRWQHMALVDGRTMILEAAHNEEGARALEANLKKLVLDSSRKPIVVCGTLGQQRADELMPIVARYASAIYLLVPEQPRACSFAELRAALPADHGLEVRNASVSELFPGPGRCSVGGPEDTILVTGSIYMLGEILARLEQDTGAESIHLQDKI
ncbi:MAG: folylpolyglutamate synthase/dihydrofolate synthase family protein [Verrucomicrobiota bacterium]